jgi:glycosyltransferase involved in cell wall biosynthesis
LSRLKILHINDGDLDDPRIVNAAITGKKAGYDVYFCGTNHSTPLSTDAFADLKQIDFTRKARLARPLISFLNYWPWYPYPHEARRVKRQLKHVIDQIRPDLIHAHNIFAGYYASSFGIPMVLDDHELYSVEVKAEYAEATGVKARMKARLKGGRWETYEHELGVRHPIITVSEKIADHHKQYCQSVFVVPNYPLQNAIKLINFANATKGNVQSVYLGRDSVLNPSSFRDITHLHEIFSDRRHVGNLARIGVATPTTTTIRSFGLLRMEDAYTIMQQQCHIGLVPWHRHWFHEYCVPNKVFEYAHCGLWLITIDDILPVVNDFGSLCDTFGNYEELSNLLEYYNTHPDELNEKRLRSLKHAQTDLIWEKVEHKILEAYGAA